MKINLIKNVFMIIFNSVYFKDLKLIPWPHSSAVEQPAVNRLVVSSILTVAAMARWWSDWTHTPFTRAFTGLNPVRVTILTQLTDGYICIHGVLAQLGEHLPYKQRVGGSSPSNSTSADLAQLGRATDL